jgi:hypothetical protein
MLTTQTSNLAPCFQQKRLENVLINGAILQEKVTERVRKLKAENFKASNG